MRQDASFNLDSLLDTYRQKARTGLKLNDIRKGATTAAAALSAGAIMAAERADASIVVSPISGQSATATGNSASTGFATLAFDINGDSINDGTLYLAANSGSGRAAFGYGFKTKKKATKKNAAQIVATNSSYRVGRMGVGDIVGSTLADGFFTSRAFVGSFFDGTKKKATKKKATKKKTAKKKATRLGTFANGSTGYAGVAFRNASSDLLYGLLKIRFDFASDSVGNGAMSATILGGSFDDSGNPISVGEVPEPTSAVTWLGLLALGSLGVKEMRRRKREHVAESGVSAT